MNDMGGDNIYILRCDGTDISIIDSDFYEAVIRRDLEEFKGDSECLKSILTQAIDSDLEISIRIDNITYHVIRNLTEGVKMELLKIPQDRFHGIDMLKDTHDFKAWEEYNKDSPDIWRTS